MHPDLGKTKWFNLVGGDGETKRRGAWEHVDPPAQAAALNDTVAFAWRAMDAFYEEDERMLGCPYKGLASYYDVGDTRTAAWSYRAPFEEVARIADFVSFDPEKLTITIDVERLEPASGQNVISHGPDRNLSVDEIGGIQLDETAAAEA